MGLESVTILGAEVQAGGAGSIPGSGGVEGMCGELGTSPGSCPRHAGLLLCFLGQKMNKPQPQLLKIYTDICALAMQYSEIYTCALRNGWIVLGILFLTKSGSWVFSPHNHQVIGTNVCWVRLKIDEELLALGSNQGENGK